MVMSAMLFLDALIGYISHQEPRVLVFLFMVVYLEDTYIYVQYMFLYIISSLYCLIFMYNFILHFSVSKVMYYALQLHETLIIVKLLFFIN